MTPPHSTPARDVLAFALVAAGAVLLLAALNALPSALGGEPRNVLRYRSADEVNERYHATLWEPHSLGQGWQWPPRRVRVAVGKVDWAQFDFGEQAAGRLVACQTVERTTTATSVPAELLPPGELLQEDEAVVAGRPVRACRLLLADGAIVHELWWRWNGRTIMLRLHGPLEALQAVAARALGSAE